MGRPKELTEEEKRQLRSKAFHPVEVWLPDFSDPNVYAQAVAEAKRIAVADSEEDILTWMEALQKDMWEGEDQI
ncbi:MAG: hypothetical protein BGN87_20335 [Rhizobiales bacterium 65-79]|jgi:hypothetical protein|nr:DUF3018 family protein [Hyphomicrobiales bacterium]OJU04354.1 MAG: hypothetical protein BGN87_20335 [Rhizobiales bacterium 65-79]